MTVLTDDGVLPLDPGLQIALVGRHAVETICMGGGSAQVTPPHQVSVADGFACRVDAGSRWSTASRCATAPWPPRSRWSPTP